MPDPSRPKIAKTETEDNDDVRVIRHYHQNGQLVKELYFKWLTADRLVWHGKSTQWSSDGELIGSFTMVEGTGISREWYDNGQICCEISMVDGKIMGLLKCWDEGGYLLADKFYYGFKPISKKKYRELQANDPSVPHYPDEAFESITKKRKAIPNG